MKRCHSHNGFSLIEVLVALVIIGVGMLGLAKIQALAYASTGTANFRSIAAIEASSLAAVMHTNRNYWSTLTATAAVPMVYQFVGAAAPTSTDATLTSAPCSSACASGPLAAYDVQQWVAAVNLVLPNATGTITCATPATGGPVGCTIQLLWSESNVAVNAQAQGNTMTQKPYILYVVP